MLKYMKAVALGMIAMAVFSACGANLYKSLEKDDPAEDAALALEDGDAESAIDILETALHDDPSNPKLLSILSYAYAARAGVEPLTLALRMGTNSSSNNGGNQNSNNGTMSQLFDVVPEPTTGNLNDIARAVEILASEIAYEDRLPGDTLKLALFQTASFAMRMKAVDLNGDGQISIEELAALSSASANGILNQLSAAQSQLASAPQDDKTSQAAAEALSQYQDLINSQPGTTDEEKLKNFLATLNS